MQPSGEACRFNASQCKDLRKQGRGDRIKPRKYYTRKPYEYLRPIRMTKKPIVQHVIEAINRHDIESLHRLIAEGASPSAVGNFSHSGNVTMLNYAAGCQFKEGVRTLIDAGGDPNISETAGLGGDGGGGTALHSAIYGDDVRPGTGTKHATADDRLQIVKMLLDAGADPNAIRNGGELPLAKAARNGQFEICQRLIEAGAMFKTWPTGCTPPLLGPAAGASPFNPNEEQKLERVAKLLLDLGAPVDGEGPNGGTALAAAAFGSSERLVNLFLEYGADVNHRDKNGRTALIRVAESVRGNTSPEKYQFALQVAKRLVEKGADANIRNNKGDTAYEIASLNQAASIVANYLKNRARIAE